jgi:hypothetical protein
MDWRTWVFNRIQSLAGGRVFSTLDGAPDERPFIVIRLAQDVPEIHSSEGGQSTNCLIWVYDEPGSYLGIDTLLKQVRTAIIGPVAQSNGIDAIWLGDSQDLADDEWGVITRNGTYRLVGRMG